MNEYKQSAEYLKQYINNIDVVIVLGSGLGEITKEIQNAISIQYQNIPHFKKTSLEHHKGEIVYGKLAGKDVLCLSGRYHYYEGHEVNDTTFPIRVVKLLGADKIILTNAAGGINKDFEAGDLMLINDHIKLSSLSPLRGINIDEFGPRFVDMTNAYNKDLLKIARQAAININISVCEGVYAYMAGPQFETPAEVRALSILGADAVGMSTVAETIVANHCGMKVLGISCISNKAAGITNQEITNEEVVEVASKAYDKFSSYVKEIIKNI